jgi:hypothetical protein
MAVAMAVYLGDRDFLTKLTAVEGERWLRADAEGFAGRGSSTTAHFFLAEWRKRAELSEKDRPYWAEILPSRTIYGEGGYARYVVRNDGEVVLDGGSTHKEKTSLAERLGFRVLR